MQFYASYFRGCEFAGVGMMAIYHVAALVSLPLLLAKKKRKIKERLKRADQDGDGRKMRKMADVLEKMSQNEYKWERRLYEQSNSKSFIVPC